LSSARNAGLDATAGEYVDFVDSDDYIDENYYEVLIRNAADNNADIANVSTNFLNKKGKQAILSPYHEFCLSKFSDKVDMFRGGNVWDKIFRRNLLARHGIRFSEGHNWEGNLFLLKAAFYSDKMSSSMDSFYHYTQNPDSICRNPSAEMEQKRIADRLFVCNDIANWLRSERLSSRDFLSAMRLVERSVIDGGFYRKHKVAVWNALGFSTVIRWRTGRKMKKFFRST
jgi:glycosyltransferase involved in cell wall biosynthesis